MEKLNLPLFTEQEICEWNERAFARMQKDAPLIIKVKHRSLQAIKRERDNFRKNGYKFYGEKYRDVWIADPRK